MFGSRRKRRNIDPSRYFPIVGVLALVVLAVAVYISYNANSGVPGQSFREVYVELRDANRLVKSNEVRIAGYRVGSVAKVMAEPAPAGATTSAPYAKVLLKLKASEAKNIPVDSVTSIRPASVLGATYVDIKPGTSTRYVQDGDTLGVDQSRRTVQLTDLLDLFDTRTSANLQGAITSLGDGLVGRGADLGQTISLTSQTLPILSEAMRTLSSSRIGPLIGSFDRTVGAVNAQSQAFADGFANGQRTFAALDDRRADLGDTIDTLPGAANTTTSALARLRPALDNLADISTDLRPAATDLPGSVRSLNDLLDQAIPTFRIFRRTAPRLQGTARSLRAFAQTPETSSTLRKVGDLAQVIAPLSKTLGEAQEQCNTLGMFLNNLPVTFAGAGAGNAGSAYVRFKGLGASPLEITQNAKPLKNLHTNYLPNETRQECEAGNQTWDGTSQDLSNPAGLQGKSQFATPVAPEHTAQARSIGLLTAPPAAVRR